jgi:hypothetical protein
MERDMPKPSQESNEEWIRRVKNEREDRYGLPVIHAIIEEKARIKKEAFQHQIELDRAEWEGMIKP